MASNPWYAPLNRGLRAAAFFVAHLISALIIIGGIYVIQTLLLHMGNPKLFDRIPVKYIFDAMDVFVLIVFVVFGTAEAYVVFQEHHKGTPPMRRSK
jgi:hypothetical protein